MQPFVITGTGRAGTMGMSVLLNQGGVRTSFEEFFCARQVSAEVAQTYTSWLELTGIAGEVSSLAPPYLRHLSKEVMVLHQVRNPIAVLASLMGEWASVADGRIRWFPNIKFNRLYVPSTSVEDPPLTFYVKYWLAWNTMIESRATWRYRIEDVGTKAGVWAELLGQIGAQPNAVRAITDYPRNYNAGKPDKRLTWRSFPPGRWKDRVLQKAMAYGYSEAELDAYCPCPAECPHCNKGPGNMEIVMQDLERYYRTPGNVTNGLVDLYRVAGGADKIGVEVGCAKGESAEIACQFLKHLYCVDAWEPGFETNEPDFDRRMAGVPNHTKIKKPSAEACKDFPDGFFDVAYVDAKHEYKYVREDFLCWFPKVKMGGYFAGHDYDYEIEGHAGVIRAVDEIFGQPKRRFVDTSFLFRKTPALVARVALALKEPHV